MWFFSDVAYKVRSFCACAFYGFYARVIHNLISKIQRANNSYTFEQRKTSLTSLLNLKVLGN